MGIAEGKYLSQETMGWLMNQSREEQAFYLRSGSGPLEYGYEWPAMARKRAACCREIALAACDSGVAEQWTELANDYEESASR